MSLSDLSIFPCRPSCDKCPNLYLEEKKGILLSFPPHYPLPLSHTILSDHLSTQIHQTYAKKCFSRAFGSSFLRTPVWHKTLNK
jgi:hypothetical protein